MNTAPQLKGQSMKNIGRILYKQRYLFMMSIPLVIWLFIFAYVPLAGWAMAFYDYKLGKSFLSMPWAGLKHFQALLSDPRFYLAMKNTVIMSLLSIVTSAFVLPILFALFLNEIRGIMFKRTVQTISYLPHFVSWVVVAGMFIQMLSPMNGIVNDFLMATGIIKEPIHFLADPDKFYAISTIIDCWKELGWNAIIFIAAIAGIDQELYEACSVDGGGRFTKMWNITLPGIRSTIIIMLIMSAGNLVSAGFEKPMLLSNPLNRSAAEVIDIYAIRTGIDMLRFSFGTAIGIFRSAIALLLVFGANYLSKRFTQESLI